MTDDVQPMEKAYDSILAPYRVGHQILLVGKNPLPNAVAGKLLTMPSGKITLIHSWDTAPIARKLQSWLKGEGLPLPEMKEVEESNATSIMQGVLSQLSDSDGKTLGLNYTGGTKAMSVHAYRAVENWGKDKKHKPIFSYLDARTLQLIFDANDPASGEQSYAMYVGELLQVKLSDLLNLHDWSLMHNPTRHPKLPETAEALASAYSTSQGATQWRKWKSDQLFNKCHDSKTNKWKENGILRFINLTLPDHSELRDVQIALQKALKVTTDEFNIGKVKNDYRFNKEEDFCDWLNGYWLEHYVLYVLKSLSKNLKLHECVMNVRTLNVDFEVDVIAIRGYQLFAFSCSTIKANDKVGREELKKKLFEAFVRARQLGGDEARLALVCSSNDPDKLEDEMRRDFDPDSRIRVFGRDNLDKLGQHIEEWINSQSGEPT
jgi:hypothetical protein